VISAKLRLEAIDPVHWANLLRLMHPPPGGDPEPQVWGPLDRLMKATAAPAPREPSTALSPETPALALLRGERVLRIVRWGGGQLPASELASPRQEDLRAFRKRHQLPFVAAVDLDALPALWAEAQAKVALGEDYVAQLLAMARVAREGLGKSLHLDPPVMGLMPIPSFSVLQTSFNTILPDNRSVVFYLLDGSRVWTSLIAAKRAGDIYLVTTHQAIADKVYFTDLRAHAPAVLKAVAERFDPPHLGLFLPLRVWQELVAGDRSAIARALTTRTAVVDPAPPWFLALIGAGAVAEAASRSARLAGRLLAGTRLGSLIPSGTAAEKLVHSVAHPFEALGLDPWELLRWARDWARRLELDRELLQR
jgi:hypothetical protein